MMQSFMVLVLEMAEEVKSSVPDSKVWLTILKWDIRRVHISQRLDRCIYETDGLENSKSIEQDCRKYLLLTALWWPEYGGAVLCH